LPACANGNGEPRLQQLVACQNDVPVNLAGHPVSLLLRAA